MSRAVHDYLERLCRAAEDRGMTVTAHENNSVTLETSKPVFHQITIWGIDPLAILERFERLDDPMLAVDPDRIERAVNG